jgi:NADH-quinone oxidoreductase subunit E
MKRYTRLSGATVLTDQERQEIEEELKHCGRPRAAAVTALMVVRKHRGWVSDEALHDIAGTLHMTVDELDGLATAYSLVFRRPVGRHVILICDSVSCWIMGYDGVRERLAARLGINLGETTSDGRFTLLPVACLGACDHAPAMMVDEELYGDLTPEKIDGILATYS